MNERAILEKSIKDHQKAVDEARRKLEELRVTYSLGDRFTGPSNRKYILARQGIGTVFLINLENGCWYRGAIAVKDVCSITQEEFAEINGIGDFVRYWDSITRTKT